MATEGQSGRGRGGSDVSCVCVGDTDGTCKWALIFHFLNPCGGPQTDRSERALAMLILLSPAPSVPNP